MFFSRHLPKLGFSFSLVLCLHLSSYFVMYLNFLLGNRHLHLVSDPNGPSPCFLSFCHTHFDPCLPLHPLQLILVEANTLLYGKTVTIQTLSSTVRLFCSSKIASKSTTNSSLWPVLLCSARLLNDRSLTCDTDLQFTLLNYLRKKLDNSKINVCIVWICEATSVTSQSYKATSCTLYNAASVFKFYAISLDLL